MRLKNIIILLAIFIVLGGYLYYSSLSQPSPPKEADVYAWQIDREDLQHINIWLIQDGMSESFVKVEDSWHFDNPERTPVNKARWGGGIPILLTGPKPERIITENASTEELDTFGLTQPRMSITMTLKNKAMLEIIIGDRVPDSSAFYLQIPNSNNVAVVDESWYVVFEHLVKEPPYPTP